MPENDSKIAFFVRDQIKEGLSEQDALEMAAEHFSKVSSGSVTYGASADCHFATNFDIAIRSMR